MSDTPSTRPQHDAGEAGLSSKSATVGLRISSMVPAWRARVSADEEQTAQAGRNRCLFERPGCS
jgi:hypothetical protein